MANIYGDRIQETSATSGLTNFTLAGAVSGYRAFSSELVNGDTCSYLAISGTQWEVGIGTYNAGVLERTTVQSSSTGGGAVNFSSAPNLLNTWSAADAAAGGGGGGNVSNTGVPVNNQVPIWTNATTIEGSANLTFDGTTLTAAGFSGPLTGNVTGNASGSSGSCTGNAATASAVAVGGITGLGTGVATALSVNVGTAGAPVILNGAGGTPISLTLTSATGLPLTTGVTGDLPFANLTPATAQSLLLGRGQGAGGGDFQELTLGSGLSMAGTVLSVSAGGGNVSNTGTPVDNQLAVWTSASVIEGNAGLTWDGSVLTATAFSGPLTGNVTGNVSGSSGSCTGNSATATTATVSTTVTVANEAADTTCFPTFVTAATGDLGEKTNAALTFNSATASLGCTTFVGALTGNASTASAVAVGGITGLGAGVSTWLATPSSANLATAVTDETGSGALTFATSPTFTTSVAVNGYLDVTEIATPTAPGASACRIWAENNNGIGVLHWESDLAIDHQIGRDLLAIVRNVSGGVIAKGEVVYITGATGTVPTVAKAKADSSTTMPSFGIAVAAISNNAFGQVAFAGDVTGLDTSAFSVGAKVYVSAATAGALTATAPSGANLTQFVGTVVTSNASTGILYVGSSTAIDPALTQTLTSKTVNLTSNTLSGTKAQFNTACSDTDFVFANDLGTGVATFLATPSSANLAAAVTDETGTDKLVFNTSPGFTTAINPLTNDAAALGTTALGWSDLFLASGGTVHFANTDWVATHTTGILTVGTGDLRVTTAGTNAASVVTVGGTQTLTGKTIAASSISAGILGGNITLGESTGQIILDPALSADGTWSGICEAGTAGATLAFGDLCYLAVADSRWELTDADASATAGPVKLGICVLAAAADGSATTMLLIGKIRVTAFPAMTIGAPVYVSTTPGDIQVAQPNGTDDVIRVVGYANTASELYFNPSFDYITSV